MELLVDRKYRVSAGGLVRGVPSGLKSGTDQWTIAGSGHCILVAVWFIVTSTGNPAPPSWAENIRFGWNPLEEINEEAGRFHRGVHPEVGHVLPQVAC